MQPILMVDLSSRSVDYYCVPEEWEHTFLGGSSLAARLLFDHLVPEMDVLSPQTPLLFLTGPLTGTSGPSVGRFVICGRSPYTGIWGESNVGGFWGPELRKAGFDGLWVNGQADQPVYLWIHDGDVEIRPGFHLWGLDTYTTQASIQAGLPVKGASVAVIGPAGEKTIPYALILTDHGRVAGRTGMGALMGSKRLKGIAVKGSGKVPVKNPELYASRRAEANRQLRNDAVATVLRDLGTGSAAEYLDYLGEMPKKYFQMKHYPSEIRLTGAHLAEKSLVGVSACHACVIACGRVVRLSEPHEEKRADPLFSSAKRKGPEYETMMGFGPNLCLNNLEFATRMGELCDRYGVDSISLSGTIGLAFQLFESGVINVRDTDGLILEWGNEEIVETLVHKACRKEGFGLYLAHGSRALARAYGCEGEAVQVNGLELAYHDPRGASGMAIVYATSPRGACHNQSDYFLAEVGQIESSIGLESFDRHAGVEKVANIVKHQDWRTFFNSLVLCFFSNISPGTVLGLVNAACGFEWEIPDLLLAGERGWNLKRMINYRLGVRKHHDCLPKTILSPYQDAQLNGDAFVPDFEAMLQAYYRVRGWDENTGFPTDEKLHSLGLEFAI